MAGEKNPNYGNGWKIAGEKHPNFDHTLYDFENKVLGIVEMQVTRYSMAQKYGLSSKVIGYIVSGKQLSHKGWTLLPTETKGSWECPCQTGSACVIMKEQGFQEEGPWAPLILRQDL